MKSGRSLIIWIPRGGSGKIHKFFISPSLIRLFFFLVLLCVCAVPFLETGLLTFLKRINDLEHKKQVLQAEISSLHYLRRELGRVEEKERMLRNHFGMEDYRILNPIMGGGGKSNLQLSRDDFSQKGVGDRSHESHIVSDMTLPMKLKTLGSNYEILNQLLVKQGEAWGITPSIIPVDLEKPKISSGFGWRKNPFTNRRELHAGIDIIGLKGIKIIAPANGVVIRKGYDQWLGNYLVLQHNDEIKTIYGHLDRISVDRGVIVKRGDLLGFMGNSGLSTSIHLHYAVIVNGRAVDPLQYILDMEG